MIQSILLVDDSKESLELYSSLFKKHCSATVIQAQRPSDAIRLAHEHFFDIVLIDVTMNYNDTQLGGLEVYKSLKPRYGDSSLIVYSKVIDDSLLRQYNYAFNFIETNIDPVKFIKDCLKLIKELREKQKCFVAMPFAEKYLPVYEVVSKSLEAANYKCIRIDQRTFTKSIVEKIFAEIVNAKFIVFVATDKNPNAYYECGYAVALNKEIVTLTDHFENLPFDIRDRTAIAYAQDYKLLGDSLQARLQKLTDTNTQ